MDRSNVSDYSRSVEFQLSLLRVTSPGEPPSSQAIEIEHLLDSPEAAPERLQ